MNKIKIGIIGSGIAGIAAANELLKDTNFEITLFDARSTLGGRINSFIDPVTKETIDNGKHLMVGAYHHFFNLLKDLQSYNNLNFQDYLNVNFFTKNGSNFKLSSGKKGKLSLLVSLFKIKNFSFTEKINFINFVLKINSLKDNTQKKDNALEILNKNKQSQKLIKHFWEPLILATMNISPMEASAKVFLEVLSQAFFSDIKNQRLVFSKIPLINLLSTFSEQKKSNLHFRFSNYIKSISPLENEKWCIENTNGEQLNFDKVILAVPVKQCLKILSNLAKNDDLEKIIDFCSKVALSPILSVYLWTKEDFLQKDFAAMIGTKFHWIFREKNNPTRFALTMSNSEEFTKLSKQEILEILKNDLKLLFPDFHTEDIIHYQVIIEKQATIKITPAIEELRPQNKLMYGLYLAGDWTATGLPATMESAAKS
ncbi:MAG: hypothetical protein A2X64_09085 [Ignavibacteria bacterium GWF2_33_9]|nr:MAG: hypothetical protein A2X64_09085 [Ignavibacteria bacterium GWF2_33_9]